MTKPPVGTVLGLNVNSSNYADVTDLAIGWSLECKPRYICVANVHMTMEAYDSADFRAVVNNADLVTSDGMPLVWMLKATGLPEATRVYGPTLTLKLCEAAAARKLPVGFYGGSSEAVTRMTNELVKRFPELDVRYVYSPPFRALTEDEDEKVVQDIRKSGARILFVGLGCPKQEYWMATHAPRLSLTQVGVGAAFDFHAGRIKQAPDWLQNSGLEWLFRLIVEPRRLWRRYLYNNPRFIVLAVLQLANYWARGGVSMFSGQRR